MPVRLPIPRESLAAFCSRWGVDRLWVFGSVLRPDFRPDSDVDVMVSFRTDVHRSLWDLGQMEEELAALLGRPVDLVTRRGVEGSRNPIRRDAILSSAELVHAA